VPLNELRTCVSDNTLPVFTPPSDVIQHSSIISLPAPAASTTNMHGIVGVATVNVDATMNSTTSNSELSSYPSAISSNLLPSSVKLLPPPSYAQVLARRTSRRNSTDISSTDISSEAEFIVSPFITSLPTRLDARYGQTSFYVAIRKPSHPDDGHISKSKLTLDASDLLHREICALLVQLAPHSILARANELGLLCALDPYFLDEATSKSILACIFCITFVWPHETITTEAVQETINIICTHNCDSPAERLISYKLNTNDLDSSRLQLKCRLAFQRLPIDLYRFAQRPPAATVNLSVSFSWNCPQAVIDSKLQMLAKRIWKRTLPASQIDEVFTRAYASTDPERPIGRISNTFHARFGLPKLEDQEARSLFTELCILHYEFKQKQLDKDPDRNLRISSLSFSFITDKGPKRRYSAPSWFDEAHRSLQHLRPDLFALHPPSSDSDHQQQHSSSFQTHQQQLQLTATTSSAATAESSTVSNTITSAPTATSASTSGTPTVRTTSEAVTYPSLASTAATATTSTTTTTISEPLYTNVVPQPLFTSVYKILLASDNDFSLLVTFAFQLEDYGQLISPRDNPQHEGNACMLLCLSAALQLSPTLLIEYFTARHDMLQTDLKLYAKNPDLQHDWKCFCTKHPHLLSSFPAPNLDPASTGWAGCWKIGCTFDAAHLNLLTPLNIRTVPILIIRDESYKNELVISLEASGNHIMYFPPTQRSTSEPIILRLRGGHFTLLRPTATTASDFLTAILPSLPSSCFFHYIETNTRILPPFVRLLSISSPIEALDDLKATHALSHFDLCSSSSRTFSQSMACAPQRLDNPVCDIVDLVNPTSFLGPHPRDSSNSPPHRSPSPSHHSSPRKAPSLGCSPPRHSLGRTPRSTSGHSTPQLASSPSRDNYPIQLDPPSSQLSSINSETDLGALVNKTCGRNDNRFAAPIGVRGYASSDETSISGSLYSSSQSATTSHTPSIFSTGSFHPAPIPSNADRPLCKCHRSMQFGCFTQDNHRCDGPDCSAHIPANTFGWHCEICSFDFCITCQPPNFPFSQDLSQSSLDDSLSTMHLASPSPSPHSTTDAPFRQEGSDAAANGRGQHA
jgi:hypothetical protein